MPHPQPSLARARALPLTLLVCAQPLCAQTEWQQSSISVGQNSTGVAFGEGHYVATGDEGAILRSPDGETWSVVEEGGETVIEGLAYAESEFLAVGDEGKAFRSADGETWMNEATPTSDFLSGVAYGEGRWIAVGGALDGSSAAIVTSDSTGVWVTQQPGTNRFLSEVAYGGGVFVAVGLGGVITRSEDGATWNTVSSPTPRYLSGVEYLGGQFVAVGQRGTVLRSVDGQTWTLGTVGVSVWLFDVAMAGDTYVAIGELGQVFTSGDLIAWETQTSNTSRDLYAITSSSSLLVAVGGDGGTAEIIRSAIPPPPADTFVGWQQAEFDAGQLADPIISAADADPDADLLPNAVEWSHDLEPLAADPVSLWSIGREVASDGASLHPTIDYVQNVLRPLNVSVSVSTDAENWSPLEIVPAIIEATALTDTLRFTDPVEVGAGGGERRFYQLEFEIPE